MGVDRVTHNSPTEASTAIVGKRCVTKLSARLAISSQASLSRFAVQDDVVARRTRTIVELYPIRRKRDAVRMACQFTVRIAKRLDAQLRKRLDLFWFANAIAVLIDPDHDSRKLLPR